MQVLVDYISQVINFFYTLTAMVGLANYGVAIILFTIVVKVVLFPLTYQQLKSMQKMQLLQPKVAEIQKKYKNNPQKAQQAMMELYQKEGVNPFSGCLPLLVQLPVLYALFAAMRSFFNPVQNPNINLAHAGFLWIANLGVKDPYYILAVLAGAMTFLQQWVTMRRAGTAGTNDQTQRTMLYIMPVFMGYISSQFPAGLALYWAVYSLASAVEQFFVSRPGLELKGEVTSK
ncbi:MAG: membrane protein insertase YidC [Clostridia bacterium]|nr:MAG: membrane protein insertase YidC [Clostridia bacterium]